MILPCHDAGPSAYSRGLAPQPTDVQTSETSFDRPTTEKKSRDKQEERVFVVKLQKQLHPKFR